MERELREVQSLKAPMPKSVTVVGIKTEVRDLHELKAQSTMNDISLGIVMTVLSPQELIRL
jgi:hypothetical protein